MNIWSIIKGMYFTLLLLACMGCLFLATLAQGGWKPCP